MTSEEAELTKVNGGWLTHDRFFNVTEDDITHGRARNQWGCAVVRAIQRKHPDALRVRVNAKLIGFTIDEVRYTYPTPPEAVEGILKPLDTGGTPEPMTLRLRGGKMKEVIHTEDRVREVKRTYNRERRGTQTDRERQMSPNYHEYERF